MEFEDSRERYRPDEIKYLFITEAPPSIDSDRYFYYRVVTEKDYLFLNLMRALYPITYKSYLPVKELRKSKKTFLDMFMTNGCYLIEAVDEPMPKGLGTSKRISIIKNNREKLLKKINSVCNEQTKVILISSTVFAACYEYLKEADVNVVNKKDESIYFPDRWNNESFQNQMGRLLERIDWKNNAGRKKNTIKIIKKTEEQL